jgi:hypothetical protein
VLGNESSVKCIDGRTRFLSLPNRNYQQHAFPAQDEQNKVSTRTPTLPNKLLMCVRACSKVDVITDLTGSQQSTSFSEQALMLTSMVYLTTSI